VGDSIAPPAFSVFLISGFPLLPKGGTLAFYSLHALALSNPCPKGFCHPHSLGFYLIRLNKLALKERLLNPKGVLSPTFLFKKKRRQGRGRFQIREILPCKIQRYNKEHEINWLYYKNLKASKLILK